MLTQLPTACRTEAAIDAYQREEKGYLLLSFQEKPLKKTDPYAVLWRLHNKFKELAAAAEAREASTFKRKLFELSTYATRANIESVEMETSDLL
jgi:hypothetical protein